MTGEESNIMRESITATAVALQCVGMPPPLPDRKAAYIGSDDICCVCGGDAGAYGTPFNRNKVLAETFMRPDDMAWERSDAVCSACAFFTTPSTFQQCVEGRLPDVKLWPQASWRSYSHLFAHGEHRVMKNTDWREVFLNPPEPPFVAVISQSGKKNILHRAQVAGSRSRFPVQLEEETVWVTACLMELHIGVVEIALSHGWTREEVLAGDCKQNTALRMGLGEYSELRSIIRRGLNADLNGMRLAVIAAHRPAMEAAHAA